MRCTEELWGGGQVMSSQSAWEQCNAEKDCKGLMWQNTNGGDGRIVVEGNYKGCGGDVGRVPDDSWDTFVKPGLRLLKSIHCAIFVVFC